MKTQEELNALKEEVETVSRKLHELTDEELAQVTGGVPTGGVCIKDSFNPDTDYTLTNQYMDSYIKPGYPENYYKGSH